MLKKEKKNRTAHGIGELEKDKKKMPINLQRLLISKTMGWDSISYGPDWWSLNKNSYYKLCGAWVKDKYCHLSHKLKKKKNAWIGPKI